MIRPPKSISVLLATTLWLYGVPLAVGETTQPSADAASEEPTFKPEELEQLVAPIALYPDALLAQVLMASTYPLEIVEAARWQKDNPDLKDKALEDALQKQSWDASVKSLTAFPPVLTMMNDELDWTQRLGDAFLAQQSDVMESAQTLRAKAKAEGNLESNDQQTVTVEQAPANVEQTTGNVEQNVEVQPQAAATTTVIVIEPAAPQVVYVPTYNPTVVYGTWPYPTYPPYSYYPPGYVATASVISFGVGLAVGAALWGGCSWGHRGYGHGGYGGHNDVNINVNKYNNFNKTNVSNKNWKHNSDHRKGVQYRDQGTRQKYDRGHDGKAQSRDAFRGRAEQGRKELDRGAAKDYKTKPAGGRDQGGQKPATDRAKGQGGQKPATDRAKGQGGQKPATDRAKGQGGQKPATDRAKGQGGQKPATDRAKGQGGRKPAADRAPAKAQRPSSQGNASSNRGGGAFQGVGDGKKTRQQSNRGNSSRKSAGKHGGGGGKHGSGGRQGGGGGHRR